MKGVSPETALAAPLPTCPDRPREDRMRTSAVTVEKVGSYASRDEALTVVEEVYRNEKGWIREVESEISREIAASAALPRPT
jgi:hypothetical protein